MWPQEEIVNACGVDDIHDGVNYVRTACVIAVSKSKEIFEPLIHQVRQIWWWLMATHNPCNLDGCAIFSAAMLATTVSVFLRLASVISAAMEYIVNDLASPDASVRTACNTSCFLTLLSLLQLGCRLAHILRRIMPISMYLLQKDGQCLSGHDLLLRRISSSFQDFIEEVGAARTFAKLRHAKC